MKRRLSSKFNNNKGETILEMLVSVLIGALATAMLAATISNCIAVSRNVDKFDAQLRQDIMDVESHTNGEEINGTIMINSTSYNVVFYGNERLMTFQSK